MKVILMLYLTLSTSATMAGDVLSGKNFNHCDSESKHFDLDYTVEYMTNNEEFEAEVYRHKNSKSCNGKAQFAVGRIWKYELNGNELITTLEEVKVMLVDPDLIDGFNQNAICGVKDWRLEKLISCEGKMAISFEELEGYRTIHQFNLKGRELSVKDEEGMKLKLIQDN